MKELIVIAGPTASGKTAMAIEVAKRVGGEIVNGDSMQVYQYMNIGTAKPDEQERQGIPHHLMDIVHPSQPFSVAKYCDLARGAIDDIHKRGRTPILVGGTGLYIDSVVNHIQFSEVKGDADYRQRLANLADLHGNEYIYQMLQTIDRESADHIMVQDRRRVIRALEVYHVTGKTITELNRLSRAVPSPYRAFQFAPLVEREVLYQRINSRVDGMIANGLIGEVQQLMDMGIGLDTTAMQAIGYKEIAQYLSGACTLDQAVEQIKQSSRRYAKRQLTWFRRNKAIEWVTSADQIGFVQ